MDPTPVFFEVNENPYRLHFPILLPGFEKSMVRPLPKKPFDANERQYEIAGFTFGSSTYDIIVREFGADIAPSLLEAWFFVGETMTDIPADLRDGIVNLNQDLTENRTQVYINNKLVSFQHIKRRKKVIS